PAVWVRGRLARDCPARRHRPQARPGPRRQGDADLLWRCPVRAPARGARSWLPARGDPVLRAVQTVAAGPGGPRPEGAGHRGGTPDAGGASAAADRARAVPPGPGTG